MDNEIIVGLDQFLIEQKTTELIANFQQNSNQPLKLEKVILHSKTNPKITFATLHSFGETKILLIDHYELTFNWVKTKLLHLTNFINQNPIRKIIIVRQPTSNRTKINLTGNFHLLPKVDANLKQRFIHNALSKAQINLSNPQLVSTIASYLPNDLAIVNQNLTKIIHWCQFTNQPLTIDQIKQIIIDSPTAKVFDLIDAIIKNQKIAAQIKLDNLAEKELNLMLIFQLLNNFLVLIIQVKALLRQGLTLQTIAVKLKKNFFFMQKIINLSRFCSNEWALHLLKMVQQWEIKARLLQITKQNMVKFFLIQLWAKPQSTNAERRNTIN